MRLFIGIFPPPETLSVITQTQHDLRELVPELPGSWVAPQNLHLTIRFLGEVSVEELPQLQYSLSQLTAQHTAVKASAAWLIAFPNLASARSINLAINAPAELGNLATDIRKMTDRLNLNEADQKAFHPHFALVRPKRPLTSEEFDLISAFTYEPVPFGINCFSLVESVLGPHGPTYTERSRYELQSTN